MTEAEWLEGADPQPMLEELRGKASERKCRLYAVACCRRILAANPDADLGAAADTAERFADERATVEELDSACRVSDEIGDGAGNTANYLLLEGASEAAVRAEEARGCAGWAVWCATCPGDRFFGPIWQYLPMWAANGIKLAKSAGYAGQAERDVDDERAVLCHLLRDIFGPTPFRSIAVDPIWLRWNHGTVPAIARHVYEDRAFHDLPVLADALEDAGCTDRAILDHCRGPGEHVRGCWVVDLLLGKE